MKHQYFGDINDYRKYGLIRGLTNFGAIRTNVCWMLTPDVEGNVDGRKLSYLDNPDIYRHSDPQLFDLLHDKVKGKDIRRVNDSNMSGILHNSHFGDMPIPTKNVARKDWFQCFLETSADADLLFFDPDNGMEVSSVRKGTKDSPKYLYWDELAAAYADGHSILVYQHFQRIQRKEFIKCLSQKACEKTFAPAVYTYTTPHVVFLLLCQEHHLDHFIEANEKIARNWHSQIIVSPPFETPQRTAVENIPGLDCTFCMLDNSRIILSNDHALAIYDDFPVTLGHSLIIPKRHVGSFFEITSKERAAMLDLVDDMRRLLQKQHGPDGFNIGINDGIAAGQTIQHLHIHLIPRYAGDTEDPRGGVRWIMPEMAPYWKKQ